MSQFQLLNEAVTLPLFEASQRSPRQRAHLNLHQDYHDPVQRFLIAMQPASYVCPHYHSEPSKWELFTVIQGEFSFFIFDNHGYITERIELVAGQSCFGLQLSPGQWHCVIAKKTNSLFFEVKRGPYNEKRDKIFALWAPQEHEVGADRYREWLTAAQPGQKFTS